MNKHIKLALIFAAAALAGTGCTVDDYNDAYLDGFDSDQEVTDIQTVSYTLTDADYSSVANNAANKAIAEAAGPEAVEALAAVGTAKCFSEAAPAETYLPAFVSAGYNSYLSNGSTVTVTYRKATAQAEEIVKLTAAETYTVTMPTALSCTPKACGIEGPVMSASMTPTLKPRRCMVTASWLVTMDLPTPPLPETTPNTLPM